MARRTFKVVDIVEILAHWYAGRPKSEVARSLGWTRRRSASTWPRPRLRVCRRAGRRYSEEQWRAKVRDWFPSLVDTRLRQPSWSEIDRHRQRIEALVGVVPASVAHQRLVDEEGLEVSVASFRRYLRAHFADEVRRGEVVIWRPPVDPGDEAQVDYGYLGTWPDPASGRRRRVWAFSMVLAYSRHLFVYPVLKMDQQAWVDAHVAALEFFGSCPRRVVLDNLRAGVIKPDTYDPKINRAYAELAAHYGLLVDPARVGKPKDKGLFSHCTSSVGLMGSRSACAYFTGGSWPVSSPRPAFAPHRRRSCSSLRSTSAVGLGRHVRGSACHSERRGPWPSAVAACRGAGFCRCRRWTRAGLERPFPSRSGDGRQLPWPFRLG